MVNFLLIGCGRIGRVHAHNLAANGRATLASCFDVSAASAAEVAKTTGARVAKTVEDALADPNITAVLIASSTDTHIDLITQCVEAGKPVLCEKPVDLDIGRVDAAWQRMAIRSAVVMIGFNRRFDPSFAALRRRLLDGEIGALEQLVITSRDPTPPPAQYVRASGGLFRDMTIHDFDMARALAGPIVQVQAMGANLIDPAIGEQGDIDGAMVLMRAASGALVHINNSRRCAYGYDQRIEAFGAAGMLQAHNRHDTTVEHWGPGHTHSADRVQDFFIARYNEAYRLELDAFIDCVEGHTAAQPSFADGRAALVLANAALESLRTNCVVSISE